LIILGHQFGRCHPTTSGYTGSWYGFDPSHWNVYGPGGLGYLSVYNMLHMFKEVRTAQGKRQWNATMFGGSTSNPPFMMLPVDMSLSWDPTYKKHVSWYDRHRLEFRSDAAKLWKRLVELGCDDMLTPERNAPALK